MPVLTNNKKRDLAILKDRLSGKTFAELASIYNLCPQFLSKICNKFPHYKKLNKSSSPVFVCKHHGLIPKSKLIIKIKTTGNLHKQCPFCTSIQRKSWRNKNPEKAKQNTITASYNQRKKLYDPYIKIIIQNQFGIPYHEIPQELVELKRAKILLRRSIKEKTGK